MMKKLTLYLFTAFLALISAVMWLESLFWALGFWNKMGATLVVTLSIMSAVHYMVKVFETRSLIKKFTCVLSYRKMTAQARWRYLWKI